MVLTENQIELNNLTKSDLKYSHILFKSEHLIYKSNKIIFGYAIEILDLINTVTKANKIYKELGLQKYISTSILYEVIEAALNEYGFNDNQLLTYYSTMQEIEKFVKMMENFVSIQSLVPLAVEYVLFGFGYEDQEKLSKDQAQELDEEFDDISCKPEFKKPEIIEFIKDARILIDRSKIEIVKTE